MNNFGFVNVNVLRVAPQHGQNKVVNRWNRLVLVPEEHVQKVLYTHEKNININMNIYKNNRFVILIISNFILLFYLFSKKGWRGDFDRVEEIMVCG